MLTQLIESALRSLTLGAIVWFGLKAIRVRNPHAQMTAWTVVLIASLAMPLLMQSVTIAIPAGRLLPVVETQLDLLDVQASLSAGAAQDKSVAANSPFNWWTVAILIYFSTAALLSVRLLVGLALTWKIWRAARTIREDWTAGSDVRTSDDIGMPVTFGSTILLPADYVGWPLSKRRAVLLHERSHVARRDFHIQLLASLYRALFWFNPLAWWLQRRLAELAEILSDDAVIESMGDRPGYAQLLLVIAKGERQIGAGIAMARPATVAGRVERLLRETSSPGRMNRRRWTLLIVPLMTLVIFVAGCALHTESAASSSISTNSPSSTEADRAIANNDLKGAEIDLQNAVKAAPDDAALRLKLASVELRLDDVNGAQTDLKFARTHGADEAKIIPLLARTYMMQNKYGQFLQDFPVRNDATAEVRATTLVARADAQIALKKEDDARSSLVAAEQLQPQSVAPKLGLARISFRLNQLDDALSKVDEIIKVAPTADAHILKGEILNRKGDRPAAITEFDAAIEAEPNNMAGYLDRTQTLIAQNEDAKAEEDVKKAIAINDHSVPANYLEALILSRRKDYAGADAVLTKFAPAFSQFPRGYYLQAVVKSALKESEEAESAINAFLATAPNDIQGLKVRAEILRSKGAAAGAR